VIKTGNIFAIWLGLFATLHAQPVQLKATVSPNPVGVGQALEYMVELSGESTSLPDLKQPAFPNLKVVSGPNVSTSISMDNFKTTASKTYVWTLLTRTNGKVKIPAPTIQYKGKTYQGNAVTLTVSDKIKSTSGQKNASQDLSDKIFFKTLVSNETPYLNQKITVTYKLYFNLQISNPKIEEGNYVDLWMESYDLGNNLAISQENYQGRRYSTVTIKKFAAYPTKVGTINIPPMTVFVDALLPQKKKRRRSIFDDFMTPFGQQKRLTLSSNQVPINVQPFPASQPENFSGLVGNFELSGNINADTVKVNEAVTLKLRLSGNGNVYAFSEPDFKLSNEFEAYPGTLNKTINWQKRQVASASWEQVLLPRVPGVLEIPAYTLSWFDPIKKTFSSEVVGPFRLVVTTDAGQLVYRDTPVTNRQSVVALGQDIRFLKKYNGLHRRDGNDWYNATVLTGFLLSLLIFGFVVGFKSSQDKLNANAGLSRSRAARKMADKHLKEAKTNMEASNDIFYAALHKGIIGFIADKLNLPMASMGSTEVTAALAEKQLSENLVEEVKGFLNKLEMQRYAPVGSDEKIKKEMLEIALQLFKQLSDEM
jgi:hypothetical protein